MKERPILFSGPMVKAILGGRKTQTRRVIKPQPVNIPSGWYPDQYNHENYWCFWGPRRSKDAGRCTLPQFKCPFGQVGDRLWVRETFYDCRRETKNKLCEYCADGDEFNNSWDRGFKWTPSIHMPRWASRLTLEITGIRVERLREMSNEDAQAEGIQVSMDEHSVNLFADLWDSINGKYPWVSNPWVWVIEFRKV